MEFFGASRSERVEFFGSECIGLGAGRNALVWERVEKCRSECIGLGAGFRIFWKDPDIIAAVRLCTTTVLD